MLNSFLKNDQDYISAYYYNKWDNDYGSNKESVFVSQHVKTIDWYNCGEPCGTPNIPIYPKYPVPRKKIKVSVDGGVLVWQGGDTESVMAVVVEAIIIVTILFLTHVLMVLDSHNFMKNGTKYN